MLIDIVPKDVVKTYRVNKVDVSITDLKLDESVTVNVLLVGEDGDLIESKNFILEGSDYSAWSSDDSYITNYVLEKLGMTEI